MAGTNYQPAAWLRSGHVQTVLPALLRRVNGVSYQRERLTTPDEDFLDLDWSRAGSNALAILSHGLEGSSQRHYIRGMVHRLNLAGLDCLAWNYRGCSGEVNRQLRMYHNGATDDLDLVVRHAIRRGYSAIFLVGFSMGGNLSLLYLSELADQVIPEIKGVVAFSVPTQLADAAEQLKRPANWFYMQRFLRDLRYKVKQKMAQYPDALDDDGYHHIRDFKAFDDRYTAPLHGFDSAEHYWQQCSCGPRLSQLQVPGLLVNARNDPFLGRHCYPCADEVSHYLTTSYPDHGGHVGFMQHGLHGDYWSESRTLAFIEQLLSDG